MALHDITKTMIAVLRESGTKDAAVVADHLTYLDARVMLTETSTELLDVLARVRDQYGPLGVRLVMDALDVIADVDDRCEPAVVEGNLAAYSPERNPWSR